MFLTRACIATLIAHSTFAMENQAKRFTQQTNLNFIRKQLDVCPDNATRFEDIFWWEKVQLAAKKTFPFLDQDLNADNDYGMIAEKVEIDPKSHPMYYGMYGKTTCRGVAFAKENFAQATSVLQMEQWPNAYTAWDYITKKMERFGATDTFRRNYIFKDACRGTKCWNDQFLKGNEYQQDRLNWSRFLLEFIHEHAKKYKDLKINFVVPAGNINFCNNPTRSELDFLMAIWPRLTNEERSWFVFWKDNTMTYKGDEGVFDIEMETNTWNQEYSKL